MSKFELVTYVEGREYPQLTCYILNRGWNSGKPMDKPCPNCFVCICESEDSKHSLYWISYTLWQAKQFHLLLKGSVIPFLSIYDAKKIYLKSFATVEANTVDFLTGINLVRKLEENRKVAERQMVLLEQLKITYLRNLLK